MRLRTRPTRSDLQALHDVVHPTAPAPGPDLSALVRAELERQRADEELGRADAERRRFAGGPCRFCGVTEAIAVDENGVDMPDWTTTARGVACGWCHDWAPDEGELLEKAAFILRSEGLDGLRHVRRSGFRWEPGLAAELGVVAWADTGRPTTGQRWEHLAPIAERLATEPADTAGVTLAELLAGQADVKRSREVDRLGRRRDELRALIDSQPPDVAPLRMLGTHRPSRRQDAEAELEGVERELRLLGASS